MIEVEKLHKKHGERAILREISFTLEPGSVAAVVGPSGGGKTTLIRCMHGLTEFDGGSVRIGGVALGPGPHARQRAALASLRGRAGFVFQAFHLFAHMTVLENVVEAPIHVQKKSPAQARDKALHLLEKVGLAHRKDALPKSLSGGESQRAAIARALAMEPEVLFMDEPTSALDPQRVSSLIELLGALRDEGLMLVTVTHDIGFARRLADRVLVLVDGNLEEEGPPSEVLERPKSEKTRAFLGHEEG